LKRKSDPLAASSNRDGVVLVDIDGERIGRHAEVGGLIAIFLFKDGDSSAFIGRDIGPNCEPPSRSAGGAVADPLPLDLDCHAGIQSLEALGP